MSREALPPDAKIQLTDEDAIEIHGFIPGAWDPAVAQLREMLERKRAIDAETPEEKETARLNAEEMRNDHTTEY